MAAFLEDRMNYEVKSNHENGKELRENAMRTMQDRQRPSGFRSVAQRLSRVGAVADAGKFKQDTL